MSTSEIIKNVCGYVGSAISMCFFLSAIIPIRKMIRKEITYKEIPLLLFIMSLLNCLLWGVYGIFLKEIPSWLCNGLGVLTQIIWLIIYWYYFSNCKILLAILYNSIMFCIVAGIFCICYFVAGEKHMEVIGYVAMVFNILMYAAPGEKIYRVYQTGDYDLIPLWSSIGGLFSSSFWGIFGFILDKISMIVPNALGVFFSILQIGVWIFYCRRKNSMLTNNAISENEIQTELITKEES